MFYAFADEMPVTIAPDDVWGCITYAFQRHVNDYAEKLRHLFVKHEGKKELEVRVDHMVLGQSKPEVWEKDVFASFSKQVLRRMIRRSFFLKKETLQIKEHVGERVYNTIIPTFSTTTPIIKLRFVKLFYYFIF